MNILRLVAEEREKKKNPKAPNPAFQKLEAEASKDKGECPIAIPKEELRKKLTPVQYHVTQEKGTERSPHPSTPSSPTNPHGVNIGSSYSPDPDPVDLRAMATYEDLKKESERAVKETQDPLVKVTERDLRRKLTPLQYKVTQERETERAFSGKYVRMKDEGVYVCIICDNPLFTSDCKYDTMCGWPAFQDVIAQGKVTLKKDTTHGLQRIEASCSQCGSHLGHVFDDGPKPSRIRYCVNSASLDFKKHTTV